MWKDPPMPDGMRITHPRPQFRRREWHSLDGEWEFALDSEAQWRSPHEAQFDRRIIVPFAPETRASGVFETGFFKSCWYRTRIAAPPLGPGERLRIHFGAVDDEAEVWANGQRIAYHL